MHRFLPCAILVGLFRPQTTHPQNRPPGATITGQVVFADTDRPARFATAYLKPTLPPDPSGDFFTVLMDSAILNMQSHQAGTASSPNDATALQQARAAATGFLTGVTDAMLCATIAADGTYRFTGVPPGSYFLHVKAPGYVDTLTQFSAQDLASHDATIIKRIAAAVPILTVSASEQIREELRLDRGAALTGILKYDDGSPATGWTVTAIARHSDSTGPPPTIFGIDLNAIPLITRLDRTLTDDTGHYRIGGLPTGDYILEARLTTAALDREAFAPVASAPGSFLSMLGGLSGLSGLHLLVYSGNTPRLPDAESFHLRAGEERTVPELTAALNAGRAIAGTVIVQPGGHLINDGVVELTAQTKNGDDDPSLTFSATIHPDGSFRFDYVPGPGKYTLRAVHPSDSTTAASTMRLLGSLIAEHKPLRTYAPVALPIELTDADLTGIRLPVADPSAPTVAAAH